MCFIESKVTIKSEKENVHFSSQSSQASCMNGSQNMVFIYDCVVMI